jgi:hypothetical protein
MTLELLVKLITRWELLLVCGVVMVLIPLVSYVASTRPRAPRGRFIPPADRALLEPPRMTPRQGPRPRARAPRQEPGAETPEQEPRTRMPRQGLRARLVRTQEPVES